MVRLKAYPKMRIATKTLTTSPFPLEIWFGTLALIVWLIHLEVVSGQETVVVDVEYVRLTNERAQKIVSRLELKDAGRELRVRDQIAKFYRDLNAIHSKRDAELKSTNSLHKDDAGTREASFAKALSESEAKQFRLHYAFLGGLGAELDGDEIELVKNGLTYDVVPKTLQQYFKLHPKLTPEQKRTIHRLLLEAREHAMDAGSSEEKHGMFRKYKGQINTFLSAEGYDAKQAERDLKASQEK